MTNTHVFLLAAFMLAGGVTLSVLGTAPELASALVGAAIGAAGGRAGTVPRSSQQ